jgi:hypothetical protein
LSYNYIIRKNKVARFFEIIHDQTSDVKFMGLTDASNIRAYAVNKEQTYTTNASIDLKAWYMNYYGPSNILSKYNRITTWLDSDLAGIKGAAKVRRVLAMLTTVDNVITKEDPKKLSNEQIRETLCLKTQVT